MEKGDHRSQLRKGSFLVYNQAWFYMLYVKVHDFGVSFHSQAEESIISGEMADLSLSEEYPSQK